MITNEPIVYYPTDHTLVTGDTFTYNMGKIVPVKVLEGKQSEYRNIYGPEYRVRYTGTTEVCLDLGQGWYLKPGDVFVTRQNNIDAALRDRKTYAAKG